MYILYTYSYTNTVKKNGVFMFCHCNETFLQNVRGNDLTGITIHFVMLLKLQHFIGSKIFSSFNSNI